MTPAKPPKDTWIIEAVILVLLLVILNPYRNRNIEHTGILKKRPANAINLALGYVQTGIFPNYSQPFEAAYMKLAATAPDKLLTMDLQKSFPRTYWPESQAQLDIFRGNEAGPVFLIAFLWKQFNSYTVGIILYAFKMLHLVTIAALFSLVCRWKIPGAALLTAIVVAYSPPLLFTLFGVMNYFFQPVFCALAAFCLVISLPWKDKGPLKTEAFALRLLTIALGGALIALGATLRKPILYFSFSIVALLALKILLIRRKREWFLLLAFLLGFVAAIVFTHPQRNRVFWHPIWTGLGEFKNPYGFVWNDYAAFDYARSIKPGVELFSEDYETILKLQVASVVFKDPRWFGNVVVKRFTRLSQTWLEILPFGTRNLPQTSSVLFWIALIGLPLVAGVSRDWPVLFAIAPFLGDCVSPLLVFSGYDFYNLTAYFGIALALIYVIGKSGQYIFRRVRPSGQIQFPRRSSRAPRLRLS